MNKCKKYVDEAPENVEAKQDTTAEEILRRCNNEMLKAMFTNTNSSGKSGAPSHPASNQN